MAALPKAGPIYWLPPELDAAIDTGWAELVYAVDAAPGATALDWRMILFQNRLAFLGIML